MGRKRRRRVRAQRGASALAAAMVATLALTGCSEPHPEVPPGESPPLVPVTAEDSPMALSLHSTAFQQGQPIPAKYTDDGDNVSPPLSWDPPPEGTRQLALICDDPDAPSPEPWVHWVIYAIAADVTSLPEGISTSRQIDAPVAAMQGKNSWTSGMTIGYRGPAPPRGHGVHHYHFKLYALKSELKLNPGLTKAQLLDAMRPHVIATGELIGTYSR